MNLVLDTNVWLDWLVFRDPCTATLAQRIGTGEIRVHASQAMLDEFAAVIARPQFGLDDRTQADRVDTQRAQVVMHPPAPDCRLDCTDPDDRKFIDLAVALRVDWLLSRDKALLRLRRPAQLRWALRIGTPNMWLAAQTAGQVPPL